VLEIILGRKGNCVTYGEEDLNNIKRKYIIIKGRVR
jgi:hypothetical protein